MTSEKEITLHLGDLVYLLPCIRGILSIDCFCWLSSKVFYWDLLCENY